MRWLYHDVKLILIVKPVDNKDASDEEGSGKNNIDHELEISKIESQKSLTTFDSEHSTSNLIHTDHRPAVGLFHFDARGEGIFELVQVGNDEDLGEVLLDQVDRLDQALASQCIL